MWLTDIEIFAVIIAALIHDYEHTGTTNAFHVNTRSVLVHEPVGMEMIDELHFHASCLIRHIAASAVGPAELRPSRLMAD